MYYLIFYLLKITIIKTNYAVYNLCLLNRFIKKTQIEMLEIDEIRLVYTYATLDLGKLLYVLFVMLIYFIILFGMGVIHKCESIAYCFCLFPNN